MTLLKQNKSGFTLIEILMTLGIVSILLITLTQVFSGIISLRLSSDLTTALSQDSRYLLTILEHDLVSATSVSAPATSTSGSSLIIQSQQNNITYSYDGTTLTRTSGALTDSVVTDSELTSFVVTRGSDIDGKAAISISFTLATMALSDKPAQSRTFNTTYALRTL